ncbi:GNAT family N-acetyltransferase [Roseomonas sp. GC11]|uniref:GNAT family N-acetyltransferase n=1 Tax=Roseomonas sp. GC11 TaxID=2950546 RepID=UPI00210D5198|nr:GNAT family N-acetyltransferase [Roseomonas sp. GC11]MCQ4162180.1 GNAT family N-acetyltransferase [Roseomonas sp. GC11]
MPPVPRRILPADQPALLALNNQHAEAVNALPPEGFAALCARAAWSGAVWEGGRPLGFLLALGPEGPATGPNHAWMQAHHPEAAYIDRVVVEAAAQGRGLGRALYAALAAWAAGAGFTRLGCEVNLDPPNPGSMAFHARLGFETAGEATDPRNGKRLRYLVTGTRRPLIAHFLRSPDEAPLSGAPGLNTSPAEPPDRVADPQIA